MKQNVVSMMGLLAISLIIGAFCVSCSETNTPTAAVKAFYEAIEKGDAAALGKVTTPETATLMTALMSMAQANLVSNPIQSYTEQIADDGNTAVVTITSQDNSTADIDVVKIDGKWLVSINKN